MNDDNYPHANPKPPPHPHPLSHQEELPPPPAPAGTYSPVVIIGKTVYVSGIGPLAPDAASHVAKVGSAEDAAAGVVGVDAGKKAARACALTMVRACRPPGCWFERGGGWRGLLGSLLGCVGALGRACCCSHYRK